MKNMIKTILIALFLTSCAPAKLVYNIGMTKEAFLYYNKSAEMVSEDAYSSLYSCYLIPGNWQSSLRYFSFKMGKLVDVSPGGVVPDAIIQIR